MIESGQMKELMNTINHILKIPQLQLKNLKQLQKNLENNMPNKNHILKNKYSKIFCTVQKKHD